MNGLRTDIPLGGDALFARECVFIAGAASAESLPAASAPEVAFAGRSNVGKSSLVNALTGRKALARASQNPGCTRQLNFFLLAERLMLVDLPGYGYAKASKKQIGAWTRLTRDFLRGRATLRRVCLLIDARRGIGEADAEFLAMLDEAAVSCQIVLTKCDRLSAAERAQLTESVKKVIAKHPAAMPEPLLTSAETNEGISELRNMLAAEAGGGIR